MSSLSKLAIIGDHYKSPESGECFVFIVSTQNCVCRKNNGLDLLADAVPNRWASSMRKFSSYFLKSTSAVTTFHYGLPFMSKEVNIRFIVLSEITFSNSLFLYQYCESFSVSKTVSNYCASWKRKLNIVGRLFLVELAVSRPSQVTVCANWRSQKVTDDPF